MKRAPRYLISLVMTAIYLLVSLAPLATAALHSGMIAQVLTAECTGDCRVCGCSPERSAARACCCWQKKPAGVKALKRTTEYKSCPTATAAANSKATGNCCSKPAQHADHEDEASCATIANSTPDKETTTVSISSCPCGSGKDMFFAAGEEIQHIPLRFSAGMPLQQASRFSFLQPKQLATRSDQPPEPPPKFSILA